jgi:protein gp88
MSRLLVRGSGKLARRPNYVLVKGNDKIGEDIFAFNLPAVDTCPGRSAACESCYARRGRWGFPKVQDALRRNWEASRDPFFAERMIREIRSRWVHVVRIHASGDFYSVPYIRSWARVALACREVTFYAYTRSWRLPGLRAELEDFAALENVKLWYSADLDTGMPDHMPEGVRVAWLQEDADDPVPQEADLVFRVHRLRRRQVKRIGLTLVCPVEQGGGGSTTCTSCGVCWK